MEVPLSSRPALHTELLQRDSELSIMLRDKDISRELLRTLFTIQVEEHHSLRSPSEIHIDSSKDLSTSSPLKECTLVNSSMLVERHPSP